MFRASLVIASAISFSTLAAAEISIASRDHYLIASFTYQSAAAEAALKRSYSGQLAGQRHLIDQRDVELKVARMKLAGTGKYLAAAQGRLSALEEQLASQKEQFTAVLAARDAEFAKERANYQLAAGDLLKTSEGRRALEVYLQGGPGSAETAIDLATLVAKKRSAADLRAIAQTFGNDGLAHARLTTAYVTALWENVVRTDPDNPWDFIELTLLYQQMNRTADAWSSAKRSLDLSKTERDRSVSLGQIGDILARLNDQAGAMSYYQQALDIHRKLAANDAYNVEDQDALASSIGRVADLLERKRDFDGAYSRYQEGIDIYLRISARNPSLVLAQRGLLVFQERIGDLLAQKNDWAGALALYQANLDIARRLAALDTTSVEALRDLAIGLDNVGRALAKRNDLSGALSLHREALDIRRTLVLLDPSSAVAQRGVSISLDNVGKILQSQKDRSGALERYREAYEIRRKLVAVAPSSSEAQRDVLVSLNHLADLSAKGVTWNTVLDQMNFMQASGQFAAAEAEWFNDVRVKAKAERH